ncbi:MAG: TonB family protein [Candidatus Saelkia tenebricola]|nr:TonB family protein [Candidatus Saelkia tenebricola]
MIKDNLLKKSLYISIFFHFAVLIPWPGFSNLRTKFKEDTAESPAIFAYKIKDENIFEQNSPNELQQDVKEDELEDKIKDAPTEDDIMVDSEKFPDFKVIESQENVFRIEEDQVVSLSENINAEIIPESMLNYYNAIREEIKKKAFYYKPRFQGKGAVRVLFGIDSDGILQGIMVDDNKSTRYNILRNAALKSVKHAAPFPPFPIELKNDFITCSITIEFELGGR